MMFLEQVISGGVSSMTSTTNEAEAWLAPEPAVQTTRVNPVGRTLPLGGAQVTESDPPVQMLRAVAAKVTAVPHRTSRSAGTVTSTQFPMEQPPATITGNSVELRFPPASTA